MMKRFFLILIAVLLLIPPLIAHADMIWNNSFLDNVIHKTIPLERNNFVINSKSGTLTAKEKPGSDIDFYYSRKYENGQQIYLDRVYKHNGKYWGIWAIDGHGGPSGWFPMNQLLVMYDRKDFIADHQNEFYNYTGVFDRWLVVDKIVTWQWPGSDYSKTTYNFAEGNGYYDGIEVKNINIHYAYKDTEGREWGYAAIEAIINVSIGHGALGKSLHTLDTWICLDDLTNESNIPAFNPAPEPKKWLPNGTENAFNMPLIISVAVVFVVGAAVLVLVFRRKSKS